MTSPLPSSSSFSSSPGVTMQAYPVRSLDADSDSDSDYDSSTRTRSKSSSNMEMNLISQSFPAGMISDDIDIDVDVDIDIDVDVDVNVTDVEKGQEGSVPAAAASQQEQQQEHSVASEEVMSRGLTTTTTDTTTDDEEEEDEKASFRRKMMLQEETSSSRPAEKRMSIRISGLSHQLRQSVKELHLDVDGDGELDTDEILSAVKHLTTQTKTQSSLRKIVCALCTFLVLLVACVFASTLTAARLVIDTTVDPQSGIMYANKRGSGDNTHHTIIMKTEWAALSSTATTVAQMTNEDLTVLQAILIGGSTAGVKFQVKGYARKGSSSETEEEVRILVEGGTLTYDRHGITAATGTAKVLLTFAYGEVRTGTHYHLYGPHDVYVSGGLQQQPPTHTS
mmetsp:Transcript_42523/g.43295  ORF Transcript_42523/g.43295 Transcript_42523/m.43295 type:complete len:394 (-) Transcript_42523:195-1376(-)